MCGIAGFWDPSTPASADDAKAIALRMAAALSHRGPDDHGAWADPLGGVALGHRRLAILDLSREGRQPMLSADGNLVLVFNGEIYNFQVLRQALAEAGYPFRGRSDSEVLLAAVQAWGVEQALQRFVGMFAFALWDRQARTLTLARDRIGEKPLYYGWFDGFLAFGSELGALRAHPRWQGQIDRGALALLLRHGCIPAPTSIYQGVFKLLPGCLLTLTEAQVAGGQLAAPTPYWSLRVVAERGAREPFSGDEHEAHQRLHELLLRSVREQMVADVPLGAFLSGGIDSSTIVALMQAQSRRPVRTFSIGFELAGFDEAPFARASANFLGTDHTELYLQNRDLLQVVPRLARIYDEPFADPSQIPTVLLCALARRQVTVSLSGDAGDELFGGYTRYRRTEALWQRLRPVPYTCRWWVSRRLGTAAHAGLNSRWLPARWTRFANRLDHFSGVLAASSDQALYRLQLSCLREPQRWLAAQAIPPLSPFGAWIPLADLDRRMMYLDAMAYLPDDILVKVDRAAMSVGLETRIPLLDHRLIAFAWSLPPALRQRRPPKMAVAPGSLSIPAPSHGRAA